MLALSWRCYSYRWSPNFLFYKYKNGGISFFKRTLQYFLTWKLQYFTKMDVKFPILHRFWSINFCNISHISNYNVSKEFLNYLAPFLQKFLENTHINWNGTPKCARNEHYSHIFFIWTNRALQKSLCSLHIMVPIKLSRLLWIILIIFYLPDMIKA